MSCLITVTLFTWGLGALGPWAMGHGGVSQCDFRGRGQCWVVPSQLDPKGLEVRPLTWKSAVSATEPRERLWTPGLGASLVGCTPCGLSHGTAGRCLCCSCPHWEGTTGNAMCQTSLDSAHEPHPSTDFTLCPDSVIASEYICDSSQGVLGVLPGGHQPRGWPWGLLGSGERGSCELFL